MRDEQINAFLDGLVDHDLGRIDGEQDAPHRLGRVAADKPDGIPISGERRRVEPVDDRDDVFERRIRHAHRLTAAGRPRVGAGLRHHVLRECRVARFPRRHRHGTQLVFDCPERAELPLHCRPAATV